MFDTAIILNQQSLKKFEDCVKPGGNLLYDPNGISNPPTRKDINIFKVKGTQTASEMGNPRVFNMIMLGSYLKVKPILKPDNVEKGLEKSLPERYHKLIPLNLEAIRKGEEIVETVNLINPSAEADGNG
jgi:2-oxoglutarate ferredoxin oxidoreductase subunit gamma